LADLGVPTLEAVLDNLGSSPFLDIELKDDRSLERVIDLVTAARGNPPARVVVSSFAPRALAQAHARNRALTTWLNVARLSRRTIAACLDVGCAGSASTIDTHPLSCLRSSARLARSSPSGRSLAGQR
jgi:glycerophosphoryl diester phosphodiesterase